MTRDEILKEFNVDEFSGRIKNPGRFEGEQVFAPYFYDNSCEGFYSDMIIDDIPYSLIEISEEDRKEFPDELKGMFGVIMWQNSQGFIFCKAFNEKEYRSNVSKLESDSEKEFAKL